MNVEEILTNLGYILTPDPKGWRSTRVYAGGNNPTALLIYKDGSWMDFVDGRYGSLSQLVQATLGFSDLNQAKTWLDNRGVVINVNKPELTLKIPKIFPSEWINELTPDHTYWINRGIRKEVLDELKGGIATSNIPRMGGRYVFPIVNSKNVLIGLNGRSLNNKLPKYKIIGEKNKFFFGFDINLKEIINKKEIILIESVGDAISLSSSGIKTWLCLFGVTLSNEQLTKLIQINPNKIIISTNNDGYAGNEAAKKIQRRLLKFFDKRQIEIRLPVLKDLNIMLNQTGGDSIKNLYGV